MKPLRTVALALAAAFFGACSSGGEDDGGGDTVGVPTATTVSGTVASNVALAGYEVEALAPFPRIPPNTSAAFVFSGTAAADGRYSVTTTSTVQPNFFIRAGRALLESEPQYPRLNSLAIRGGTVHVTPLTSLVIARLLNRKPSFIPDIPAAFELLDISEAQLLAAQAQVVAYLLTRPHKDNGNITSPVNVSVVTNFFSMPLIATPGDPHFEALRRLHDSLMDSETIQGVEEHMLFGSDAAADLGVMLSLDFMASCAGAGDFPGSPTAVTTRIIVNRSGATIGAVNLPFRTGDVLDLTSEQVLTQRWVFSFSGGASSVEINVFDRQLRNVQLTDLGATTLCNPLVTLPVPDRSPSQIALIRLFAQSLAASPAAFQCAAPTAFFQDGTNFFAVEANGAMSTSPAGPRLHLPSLDITMRAPLTVTAGQVGLIRPTSFVGSRSFRGGSDSLTVRFTDSGEITGLRLTRQRPLSGQSQTCGTV